MNESWGYGYFWLTFREAQVKGAVIFLRRSASSWANLTFFIHCFILFFSLKPFSIWYVKCILPNWVVTHKKTPNQSQNIECKRIRDLCFHQAVREICFPSSFWQTLDFLLKSALCVRSMMSVGSEHLSLFYTIVFSMFTCSDFRTVLMIEGLFNYTAFLILQTFNIP